MPQIIYWKSSEHFVAILMPRPSCYMGVAGGVAGGLHGKLPIYTLHENCVDQSDYR